MATQQLNRLAGLLTSAYSANRLADESDGDLLARCRTGADPAAFETIVRRHGGRVLAACRKVLTDPADVDDAFQATFLTLLRNPRAVRKAASLGAWLYGVAHRTAVRARDTAGRRRGLLKKAARPAEADPPPDLSWKEACAALHAELDRLPDTLRMPLVLCYLDGLSRDEAAAQLGWSLNEVRGRLERGRVRLRKRLEKRGIALSAGLLAAVAGNSVTAAAPPARLIEGARRAVAGRPSAGAAALAHGVSPAVVTTFQVVSALALAAGVLVGVGTQRPDAQAGPKPADSKSADAPAARDAKPDAPSEFAGRVVGPDGKPVKGAKVHLLYYTPRALPVPERAATDAGGNFRFTVKPNELDRSYQPEPWKGAIVTAHAPGLGRGWAAVGTRPTELGIRLPRDDKPLAGRLLDLEGQPLAGVAVRVTELLAPSAGKDLAGFAADLKKRKVGYPVLNDWVNGFDGGWMGRDVGSLFPPVTTDKDGRFALAGVGAERVAALRFERPGLEARTLRVLTIAAGAVTVDEWEAGPRAGERAAMTFVGNDFTYALAPGRTVTGVVRDRATGKPIPGARVESQKVAGHPVSGRFEFQAVADQDGKFALHGLPPGKGNILRASPPAGQPYLLQLRDVPVPAGAGPARLDFDLARGVELTVTVTDAATGAPVAGRVEYFGFRDNPELKDVRGFTTPGREVPEAADGVTRLVVPAGPGLVAFRARTDGYPVAVGAERFKDRMNGPFINTIPYLCHAENFTALAPVEPKPGARAAEVAVTLDAGKKARGRVLGPDGKPLAGAVARGLKSSPLVFGEWEREPLQGSEFEAVGLDPRRPRAVVFLHKEKKLAGVVRASGGEKGPVEVTLRPWATLTGRLVDADGRPQADVKLSFVKGPDEPDPEGVGDLPGHELRTDAAGRFRVGGFAPGLRYNLAAIRSNTVVAFAANGTEFKAGEEKDVGDVVVKPME